MKIKNFICIILLKLLTKAMDVDRDSPIYILFKGNDEIEIQQIGEETIKYQFK